MASYRLEAKRSFSKDLKKLSPDVVLRMMRHIKKLSENPFPKGVKKLQGSEGAYRLRLGDYRIIYEVDTENSVVLLLYARHRKDAYRRP